MCTHIASFDRFPGSSSFWDVQQAGAFRCMHRHKFAEAKPGLCKLFSSGLGTSSPSWVSFPTLSSSLLLLLLQFCPSSSPAMLRHLVCKLRATSTCISCHSIKFAFRIRMHAMSAGWFPLNRSHAVGRQGVLDTAAFSTMFRFVESLKIALLQ